MRSRRKLAKSIKKFSWVGILLGISLAMSPWLAQYAPALEGSDRLLSASNPEAAKELAQFPRLPVPDILDIPDIPSPSDILEGLLRGDPPITTSFEDALSEIPFLDDFNPKILTSMTVLPRDSKGDFRLHPGLYRLQAQSYCLHAGTYAPVGGDGYLYAPLQGSKAEIVRNILRRSVDHPEIPQRQIQVLLWAILARTQIDDMSPEIQQTATALLTSEEISELKGGALEAIPDWVIQEAIAHLPSPVRRVLHAEAELRSMLSAGQTAYDDLERVAVLFGEAPEEDVRDVPEGRWSYHPDGYFIRYFPSGYPQTQIEVYVPEPFEIERDELGRIVRIADRYGNRIETEYDDTIEPLTVPGDPNVRGYAFRTIRFVHRDIFHPEIVFSSKVEWNDAGWTLVGIPSGEGRIEMSSGRFADPGMRYEWATAHQKQLEQLDERFESEGNIDEIVALGHYSLALQHAIEGSRGEQVEWAIDHIDLVKMAWQYEVCQQEGGCEAESRTDRLADFSGFSIANPDSLADRFASLPLGETTKAEGYLNITPAEGFSQSSGGGTSFAPGVAAPANTGKQRLAQSSRPSEEKPPCEQVDLLKKYMEFAQKRRDFYKQFGDTAQSPADLDEKVRQAMEREIEQQEASGEVETEGEQQTAGHYDPCTGEKVVRNLCTLINEKPLCEWLTQGTNTHENTHEQQSRDWADQRRYCSPHVSDREKAKIASKWEYDAYDAELKLYQDILNRLRQEWPDCF